MLCLIGVGVCAGAEAVADHTKASWIWTGPQPVAVGEWECYARRTFRLEETPAAASVLITADNVYELYVNGVYVGEDGGYEAIYWSSLELYDIRELLKAGDNVIAARGKSLGGSGGLLLAARVATGPDAVTELASGADWKVRLTFDDGWNQADYDDSGWQAATVVAPHGRGPWGALTYPGPVSPMSLNRLTLMDADESFVWPEGVVFVGGFVPLKEPESFTVSVLGSRAYFEHDGPTPAAMGHRLYSLVPARPDGAVSLLHDAGKGLIGSPTVSYDGRAIYFSMAPEGDFFWRVCRISSDGSGLEILTSGYFHDYDPVELPDGRIVFSSTRIGSRDEYHANVASSLFVMDADGSDIEPLTYHIVADREPKVTADGSIVMVRADNFFERAKVETRIQQIRPDGTGGMVVLGADREAIGLDAFHAAERNSAWLRVNGYGSPAPLPDGRVAAISHYGVVVSGAFNSGRFTAEKAGVEYVPYDIAGLPDGRLLCTSLGRNWIGVMDLTLGKVARIYGDEAIHSVAYLGARERPATVASHLYPPDTRRVDKTGYLLCQSVFATKQGNVDMGRAKAVRILEGRPFTLRSAMHRFGHIGVEGVELGTVPLAADGSFYVEVPADRALAIQLVDAEGRNVVNELSWLYVRPGERLSCVGCHNPRTAGPQRMTSPLAGRAEPMRLTGGAAAHRYRANNAANGGVLNLQFDRFREAGAINLYENDAQPTDAKVDVSSRRRDIDALRRQLRDGSVEARVSAAERMALLRDRRVEADLVAAMKDSAEAVRVNAALALAACGTRQAVPGLLAALEDASPLVAQAANVALGHLSGHAPNFDGFGRQAQGAAEWRKYFTDNNWPAIEVRLVAQLAGSDASSVHAAIETLGHVGGADGRAALRAYVGKNVDGPLRHL
ncbi:MAG: HEAT repeat domain-containing protein, partial [Phycisphaerae bacterium]|nr:HEAT repeat domain-containing protein [Phycisphaerae bacterium]